MAARTTPDDPRGRISQRGHRGTPKSPNTASQYPTTTNTRATDVDPARLPHQLDTTYSQLEGIEAIVLRTVNDQPTLWDAILPSELLVLPTELARVDALLDDPVFFAPFAGYFDARIGRPSLPVETYLRLMFLKFRYRLGYESLCREVADSISWQRFCRIPLGARVPHPTTLMKITSRCGDDAVAGLNEALLVKAAAAKLLRTNKTHGCNRAGTSG
jgi:hypothetical protein